MKFRYRIALLVAPAAIALVAVTIVTLVFGRRDEQQLAGIETRYLPMIEVDHDLKNLAGQIRRTLEDAASAGEDSKLHDADVLADQLIARLHAGTEPITDNGGDPRALEDAFHAYYDGARRVSATLVAGGNPADLGPQVEAMRTAQRTFATTLDRTTHPDRARLVAAFDTAREGQRTSLAIDIAVATAALALMILLSWRIIQRTVRSLAAVSSGVERLARGEFDRDIAVAPGDELGDLAHEANRTARRLLAYRDEADREAWVKTGLTELADQLAGDVDQPSLAGKIERFFARYLGATSATLRFGGDHEGWLGEVARAGDVRVNDARIGVALPHGGRTVGVLDLTMAGPPSWRVVDLVGRARGMVAVTLRVAESRDHVRGLLSATETANKELEAFSYSVSHDLRAPLRGIDGFSQALVEDETDRLSERGRDYLKRIRAAAQRMAELIDDLLRLSRVSRGEFKRERVDLSALVGAIVDELRRAVPERAVTVDVQPEVIASGDPRLVRITLENLLGNAWKFTSKTAGARLAFGAVREGDELVYFVRDNGAGFDMKYAERLFGAFQRLHADKDFPGTGIGLATVQRIVNRHGGRIWVEAAVGEGATFRFTLP